MVFQEMHQGHAAVVAGDDGFNMLPDVMQFKSKIKSKKEKRFFGDDDYSETNFSPTTDNTSVEIKNKRQNVAGSLKKIIPISTVPTAPMPVHTA